MTFDSLRPQTPLFPAEAEQYAARALQLSRAATARCKTVLDVDYGSHADQRLDIYLPKPLRGAAPVLVFAHGGGSTHGYKEWMGLMAPPLVAAGIVFVSIGHRLAPEHKYPVPVEDCAAALSWVHHHISEHGGDPNRIVVGGHSSGGHLLSMVALQPEVLRRAKVPRQSILACAPLSARLDMDFEGRLPGSVEERHQAMLFQDPDEAKAASPISLVDPTNPPMLLAWARDDVPGVARSNERMLEALHAGGQPHEAMLLDGDHFDTALDAARPENPWVRRIVSLLTEGNR